MDYSPWPERKFWLFLKADKRGKISKAGVAMPTKVGLHAFQNLQNREATPIKIGLHAFHVDLYLHECFEPILFFDPHGLKWKFGQI